MRTDDHDPMHERREAMTAWERGLRPKRERHWVLWLVLSVLLVFLLYRGAEWLLTQRSPRPQQPPAVQSPVVPPLATGRSTAPAPSSAPRGAAAPDTFEVTKCLTPSGKAAYSDGPCPEGSRVTTVRLRRDMNLADGMSVEEREASNRNSAAIAVQQQQYERQVARNVDNTMAECSQLEAHIKWIDTVARQPQGAYSQDWLRNERQATRDLQFRLHCQ
jgi:cytoskeletal protein RodZ